MKELSDLAKEGVPGVKVEARGGNIMQWDVTIDGPAGTVYEGGHFKAVLTFPPEYPMKAPDLTFATKIYHPNVDKSGLICLPIIRENWAPSVMMKRVLQDVCHLMANPDGTHAADADVGVQFMQDRAAFDETARKWTREYAK